MVFKWKFTYTTQFMWIFIQNPYPETRFPLTHKLPVTGPQNWMVPPVIFALLRLYNQPFQLGQHLHTTHVPLKRRQQSYVLAMDGQKEAFRRKPGLETGIW